MYIFKNAWISIMRNKSRNILIGIIILVISCCSCITLAINNTANDLIKSYEDSYLKEATISFNRENMFGEMDFSKENMEDMKEKFNDVESYSIDDIKNYADSDYISDYYYTYNISLNGNNIEKAEMEMDEDMPEMPGGFGGFGGRGDKGGSSLDFTLNGYSSLQSMSDFITGKYTMDEITDDAWEKIFDGKYVFINKELAEYNELELEDVIKLEDEDGNTYKFTVVGIFSDNEESESGMSMFSNTANSLITNCDVLIDITTNNSNVNGSLSPTFIINSYDDVEAIQEEFYSKGLDETYVVSTNEEEALSAVSSVSNVKTFAVTFLIITLLIGGVVLFILNMINIRERKYEIGVFRTIGISKLKLTSQFMIELLIVALAALVLGIGSGSVLSKSVSNSLLASEIDNSNEASEEISNNFGGGRGGFSMGQGGPGNMDFNKVMGRPTVQAYDSINAVVNFTVILELLGISVLLVIVSSSAAMISIQRFSPLTILKERS